MAMIKPVEMTGWGRVPRVFGEAARPEKPAEVPAALAAAKEGVIPYGLGRSYGDAALNENGAHLLTPRMDRILSFDPGRGDIVCEAGVSFRTLYDALARRGFLPPVIPGTAHVTMGGAVAMDVHGKNHDRDGSFGKHVKWLDLITPDGQTHRLSPRKNRKWFRATIGGAGLTGVIVRVAFVMKKVPAPAIEVHEQRIDDLDAYLDALFSGRGKSLYSVGWIDALSRGAHMGRGILETGEIASAEAAGTAKRGGLPRVPMPVDLPGFVLNPFSMRAFNALWWRKVPKAGRDHVRVAEDFFWPLDAVKNWNRMYGRRGFFQFQALFPDREAAAGVQALLEKTAKAGAGSFLAVIKTMGKGGAGLLSFPDKGVTLALDFPNRAGTPELLYEMEKLVLDHGGRLYLAKDAVMGPESFQTMYPEYEKFREIAAQMDPAGRMTSTQARRLQIREES